MNLLIIKILNVICLRLSIRNLSFKMLFINKMFLVRIGLLLLTKKLFLNNNVIFLLIPTESSLGISLRKMRLLIYNTTALQFLSRLGFERLFHIELSQQLSQKLSQKCLTLVIANIIVKVMCRRRLHCLVWTLDFAVVTELTKDDTHIIVTGEVLTTIGKIFSGFERSFSLSCCWLSGQMYVRS